VKDWHKQALWVALALTGAVALWVWMPSDERRIQKLLARLTSEINEPAQGSALANLAAANRFADLFAPGFQVRVNVPGAPDLNLSARSELIQAYVDAKNQRRSIQAELLDPRTIQLAAEEAVVEATARAQVSGESELFVAELRFTLVKVDRRWRIRDVESIRTFE